MSEVGRSDTAESDTVGESVVEDAPTMRWWWLLGAFTLLALILYSPGIVNSVFNADEAFVSAQAQVLDAGGDLYVDVIDRKPPVVPAIYTAVRVVTGSPDLPWVRVVALVARIATALLLAAEAQRRWGGRCAWWAGTAFLVSASLLPLEDAQAANFEVFMVPTMVLALVLGARHRPASAGVALALSTLTKQTAAAGLLPLAYLAWRDRRWRGWIALGAGFLAPILVVALWLGFSDYLFWNWTGTSDYLNVSGVLGHAFGRGVGTTAAFVLANAVILVFAALAWRTWRRDLDLWLWLVSAVIGTAAGLRFFDHYYLQIVPIICLLAARPFDAALPRVRLIGAAVLVVTASWFAASAWQEALEDDPRLDAVSAVVVAETSEGDAIFVWGHWPELYWDTQRPPATRFLTTGFLTGHSGGRPPDITGMEYAVPGAWGDFEADLAANPPALIAVPVEFRNAEHYRPADFPRFGDWLTEHYELVDVVDDVEIWLPVSDSPTQRPG